LKSKLEKKKG